MINTADCWIETYTGKCFHLLDPKPEEIDIIDIAHSLSQQCRYTGMTIFPYSIAAHSVWVSMFVPTELCFAALMHDASEAYLSDISRGLKGALALYRDIEMIVQGAIQSKYGIGELSSAAYDIIKTADNILLVTEARDLMPRSNWKNWGIKENPLTVTIQQTTPLKDYAVFLSQFNKYCPKEFRVTDNIVQREVQVPE